MKKKLLIVDDVIENIQVIISIFERNEPDFILYQATDADIAYVIAKKIKPDLIITDWDMPGKSGIKLIQELKNDIDLKNIPVIMATGVMTTVAHLQSALDAGAIDYIRKPINEVELIARTNSALYLIETHKKDLEKKNEELVKNTLSLIKNNKFNLQILEKLDKISRIVPARNKEVHKILNEIITEIDQKIKTETWQNFEISFNNVHEGFYKNLLKQFPDLTGTEIKLCAFIRLGLSIKDIASIMYITPESVKVARSRLRKKLGLSSEMNLQTFLLNF